MTMCLAAERGVYAASPLGWRPRQNIPSLEWVRTLKRRERRAPVVPGASRTPNTYMHELYASLPCFVHINRLHHEIENPGFRHNCLIHIELDAALTALHKKCMRSGS